MKYSICLVGVVAGLGIVGCSTTGSHRGLAAENGSFEVGSTDLTDGGVVPLANVLNNAGMGCAGGNSSPEIHWTPVLGAQSYALTVDDPKAPTGSGFWHWMVINIPANVTSIAAGTSGLKAGEVIANDFGNPSYDGPCPPKGWTDAYTFTIYALTTAKLESLASKDPAFTFQGMPNSVVRFYLQAGGSIIGQPGAGQISGTGQASFTVNYTHQ